MTDDKKPETSETEPTAETTTDTSGGESTESNNQSGPTFTQSPDPLAGVKKSANDVLDSMEGKTVSMKVYVGSIIGVILLMMLARCGG
ncbi:MAG: hypothetical protein QNJ19_05040 [Woeseiaceae bacterium]|nr:hypothetical protein [Woeseiaceae bacterium]